MKYALFLLGFVATTAWAHDLWFEKEGNTYTLYQGHRHASHDGVDVVPYEARMARNFTCIDAHGAAEQFGAAKAYPARLSSECATLHATFSTGYWTKTAWETRNVPRTGISGVVRSWYSEESLKLVERWTDGSPHPIGAGLEITPTANPLPLKAGDKLVVLVTDDGKPVAGVPVAYAGNTRGTSGADGKVAIRLRRGGLQLLEASLESPLADGKADVAIRTAALQFQIVK
ncbi:DUF4198 domain-containing protein [Thiobacillus sp.]|uniref:DUF4198 domain-containing protein n=1 Tax=Thiobacillus sp. TaxID=924 RepID=UPI0025F9EC15|nr:DUF4198 domain-containing protein [Thiobacillus sp.]